MLSTPASLMTIGARMTRPSAAIRTPTARPCSTTTSATSALIRTRPPALSMTGMIDAAMTPEPPTG